MGRHLIHLTIFTLAFSKSQSWEQICPTVLLEADIDRYFSAGVVHSMHSLTLEDIRYYFKEDVPVDNGVPTVNFDLTPNVTRVLANAPASGYDTSFKTMALRHTDQVLSKMSTENWGIKHYTALEELVHAHHMAELWERSKIHFDNFVKSPPADEVCRCLTQIDENGVMAELQLLALKIKFPGLLSGEPNLPYGKNAKSPKGRKYSNSQSYTNSGGYSNFVSYSNHARSKVVTSKQKRYFNKLMKFDFEGDEDDVVDRAMKQLQDGQKADKRGLADEEGWMIWKKGFKSMNDEEFDRQFGMFMFCMLND